MVFFILFLLDDRRIRIHTPDWWIRIPIRIQEAQKHTDPDSNPDPYHWRARHAGTRDFYPAMAALVSTVQNIFPHRKLFLIVSLHRPATGANSRAGSPVS